MNDPADFSKLLGGCHDLDTLLKSGEDALVPAERGNPAQGLPPAIIMDVDETVLDNSPYQARLVRNGKEFEDLTWDQWVAEKQAKPVPGVVAFAQAADAKPSNRARGWRAQAPNSRPTQASTPHTERMSADVHTWRWDAASHCAHKPWCRPSVRCESPA